MAVGLSKTVVEGVGDHVGFAIESVRIYNDYVYVAGEDGIYRNQIQNDGLLSAKELIFEGLTQPSGYTEPILHSKRLQFKKIETN